MSKGNDARTAPGRETSGRQTGQTKGPQGTSRSSVRMTAERARAIQAHADRTDTNAEFKARAMSAAAANSVKAAEGEE
jgi:hypothetical protein